MHGRQRRGGMTLMVCDARLVPEDTQSAAVHALQLHKAVFK